MDHYDVIIIGTGAGGGTLAHRLAPSGKRILLLERGGYLPREPENWDSEEVFGRERYVTEERWYDKHGTAFRPHAQYFVGGNTKVYGAILFRLRERDFDEVEHYGGVSPAMRRGDYEAWCATSLQAVENAGQQEVLNWFALAGAMQALGARLECSEFVETHVFNSNKVFAVYAPA